MKNKSNALKLKYGEYEFIIPKKYVCFVNGYGIVNVQFTIEESILLIGVVDGDYNEVLPLTPRNLAPKLFIGLNGNFVLVAYNSAANEYQVKHLNVNGDAINLGAGDFLELDNEVVQLYYDKFSALYDTQTFEFLTPFYHYIGPFVYSEKYGCKVARATFYIEDENEKIINEVSTIINTRGEVLENYYDLAGDLLVASKDLPDVLELVRKKES